MTPLSRHKRVNHESMHHLRGHPLFRINVFRRTQHPRGDLKTFDLTPSAPSTEYWLLCNPNQRVPGNAASLYADAADLLNDKIVTHVDDAIHAYGSSDWNRFNSLSAQLDQDRLGMINAASNAHIQGLFDLLDAAARREDYDWSSPFREQGYSTLLPHLNGDRYLGSLIELHALQQIHAAKFDDTVNTLRLGFELGQKIGQEQYLISGLVGVAIIAQTSDAAAELMQQPQSPNLYWALAALPRPMISLQRAFAREPLGSRRHFINWPRIDSKIYPPTIGTKFSSKARQSFNSPTQPPPISRPTTKNCPVKSPAPCPRLASITPAHTIFPPTRSPLSIPSRSSQPIGTIRGKLRPNSNIGSPPSRLPIRS